MAHSLSLSHMQNSLNSAFRTKLHLMRLLIVSALIFSFISLSAQTHKFTGTWTKVLTTYEFDFELYLTVDAKNEVKGFFVWKVINYDKYNKSSIEYYADKLGLTAKEYVRGTYNPIRRELIMQGYKKDDPHSIIGIDTYKLEIDESGNIGGTTKANGTWMGIINGQPEEKEAS